MYCTHCGHANPADANYCANCGRSISDVASVAGPGAGEEPPETADLAVSGEVAAGAKAIVEELEPGTALLVSATASDEGARYLLDKPRVSVGRHPDSDLFLDDITVSRRHAQFRREGQGYAVDDVDSLNGTYVNGERIESHTLSTGDELQIGKFKLVVFLAESNG